MGTILVFIGHDYFGKDATKKQQYRKKFDTVFKNFNKKHLSIKLIPIYGDTKISQCKELHYEFLRQKINFPPEDYWAEIRAKIAICSFGIFDLTPSEKDVPLNYNVILEYGVALGLTENVAILAIEGTKVDHYLSNLKGVWKRFYSSDTSFHTECYEILEMFYVRLFS